VPRFIKFAVDAESKQFLGGAILGTCGDELIHVLLDQMYAKAPYTSVQRAMHIHPTVAEFFPTVLSKLEPFT
jgi:pyruvate/2-oxoglutarate dehydrogenase complex dihydrolipoamide dehydrogenase (E3) component